MTKTNMNPTMYDRAMIQNELIEMGVTIEEPETPKEESIAHSLEAFSQFVLEEQPNETLALLQQHSLNNSSSVGELSGGNSSHSIYRLSIQQQQEDPSNSTETYKGAAELLLSKFIQKYPQHASFTTEKLQQYMLNMCNKRPLRREESEITVIDDRTYSRLGNLMFILSLGQVHGQVRHIDHMNPNLQICLYMSRNCPSTIVYAMEEPSITNCLDLKDHWESSSSPSSLPWMLATILKTMGSVRLNTRNYAKYFGWISLNDQLFNFGRLFQPISHALQLKCCDPGTTLIAGGANHVHAGPPADEPRMFAFAIGIPDESIYDSEQSVDKEDKYNRLHQNGNHEEEDALDHDVDDDENDGEVQYSPVLFHLDLTCIIFGMMDFEEGLCEGKAVESYQSSCLLSKRYLLECLLPLLQEYPTETYSQHFGENRALLRDWLEELVTAQGKGNCHRIETLLQNAVASDQLMYSPDVSSKSFRKNQQRRQKRNQRNVKKNLSKKS